MEELKKALTDGKSAVNKIIILMERQKIDIPAIICLKDAWDTFIYLDGYMDCLEKQNLIKE